MTIQFYWQVPTRGDGRLADAAVKLRGERSDDQPYFTAGVTDPRGRQFNYYDHLHQIGKAAELAGFDGLLVPNDPQGEESWIVAGYLTRNTRRVKVLAAFDSARGSAVYAAKNAVSYQRYSNSRFAWQIATPADAAERLANGDFIDDADIPQRTEEFVTVARHVITETGYSFKGRFFEVLEGGFKGPLSGQAVPQVFLTGQTEADLAVSAKLADVHVFEALPLAELKPHLERLQELSAKAGRPVQAALRIDLLVRETAAEAVHDAARQARQQGQTALPDQAGLWPLQTPGAGAARATLVGDADQVIATLTDYAAAGITVFQLGAVPALEEAYRIGEQVLPALRARLGLTQQQAA